MRVAALRVLGVMAGLAASMPSYADTLAGAPIVIGARLDTGVPIETSSGDIGLTFKNSQYGPSYYQVFNNLGQKKGRVTFTDYGYSLGTIALKSNGALLGYTCESNVCGRRIYRDEILGGERSFTGYPLLHSFIKSGDAGVLLTQKPPSNPKQRLAEVRLVSRDGTVGQVVSEIVSKSKGTIEARGTFNGGFIVRRFKLQQNGTKAGFVTAQVYGANGQAAGPEFTLEPKPSSSDGNFTQVYDLSDNSLLVVRKRTTDANVEVSAEVYDRSWTLIKERTVVAQVQADQPYFVETLASGGFAIAVRLPDGTGFQITRFLSSLVAAADPLTVQLTGDVQVKAILGRKQGDMFVVYSSTVVLGTTLYGQFINP